MMECICGNAPEPVVALMHDGDEVREFFTLLCRECDAENDDVVKAVAAGAPREIQEDVLYGNRESWWPEYPCPYDLNTLGHTDNPEHWVCDQCGEERINCEAEQLVEHGVEQEMRMLLCMTCDSDVNELRFQHPEQSGLADFY
ncbi:hypothetical protein ACFPYI_06885 [Halomarina salina]|uniref:Uncharacterized protein n=1 Tax=Halomarina salina TaxID=1872699 RepID=A0ABD5RKZ6_9EURY|nr:hypothetical protein [Halomarina salina]